MPPLVIRSSGTTSVFIARRNFVETSVPQASTRRLDCAIIYVDFDESRRCCASVLLLS